MMTVKLSGFCDCKGCWRKVNDALSGVKGIEGKLIDKKNFLVTVTGTVDAEALKAKLAKIRKGVNVEVIFQGDGEKKKEEDKKPKERADTNQKEKPKKEFDTKDRAKEKSGKTRPSESNDAVAGPSSRGGNGSEPIGEQNLQRELATYPYDYGFYNGPNFPYGNGSNYEVPSYADGNGPYNHPQLQGYADGNRPYPPPEGFADGNGPSNYPPPQDFADEFSNACSIM